MSLSGRAGAKAVLVEADVVELPFGVVAAKIRPPVLRPGVVSRTALVNRLRADRSARVVSVVAPGGYGKTTLLAQWAARDDRPFAWISLDRRDNDPVVLLRHRRSAINEIMPVDPRLLDTLAAPERFDLDFASSRGSQRWSPPQTTVCSCSTTRTSVRRKRLDRGAGDRWPSTCPTARHSFSRAGSSASSTTKLRSTPACSRSVSATWR